ncbi:MAG: head maturation protease, ClpP-related [Verrucomicrobiota bacterium]
MSKNQNRPWFRMEHTAESNSADIYIYDVIGQDFFGGGVEAKGFIDELNSLGDVQEIVLHVNSPGGSVMHGNAIYNAILSHPARVVTQIEGLAASMASIIALAGTEVRMAANSLYMIHNPKSVGIGEADDLRKEADLLDKMKADAVDVYAAKSGQTEEQISKWMDEETYFTASEAKEHGFIDEITHESRAVALDDFGGVLSELKLPENFSDITAKAEDQPEPGEMTRERLDRYVKRLQAEQRGNLQQLADNAEAIFSLREENDGLHASLAVAQECAKDLESERDALSAASQQMKLDHAAALERMEESLSSRVVQQLGELGVPPVTGAVDAAPRGNAQLIAEYAKMAPGEARKKFRESHPEIDFTQQS